MADQQLALSLDSPLRAALKALLAVLKAETCPRRSKPHRIVPGTRSYKLQAATCDWCLRKTTHVLQLFGTCAKVPCCARCEKRQSGSRS